MIKRDTISEEMMQLKSIVDFYTRPHLEYIQECEDIIKENKELKETTDSKVIKNECRQIIEKTKQNLIVENEKLSIYNYIQRPIFYYDQFSVMFYLKKMLKQKIKQLKAYPNDVSLQFIINQLLKLKSDIIDFETKKEEQKKKEKEQTDKELEELRKELRKGFEGKLDLNNY